MRQVIPLKKRPIDIVLLIFFFINISFITYIVDVEQLVIADPNNFQYPLWPLPFLVDLVHWWGRTFDPVLLARPAWWKATIWLDSILFGPYYIAAIYAFIKGKEWIRIPSIIFASILFTNVFIILSEELFGIHKTPETGMVLLANVPWLIFPFIIIYRMWRSDHPFTEESTEN